MHGETPVTFMCRHLLTGVCCGFHDSEDGSQWPDAWCDLCAKVLARDGEWTDENMRAADIGVVCTGCYEQRRALNRNVPAPFAAGEVDSPEAWAKLVQLAHRSIGEKKTRLEKRVSYLEKKKWHYDGGRLSFFDPEDAEAWVADATHVGSVSNNTHTWMWAWAKDPHTHSPTLQVRTFGQVRGLEQLTNPHFAAEEIDGHELNQVTALLLGAQAIYRYPDEHVFQFFVLDNFRAEPRNRS